MNDVVSPGLFAPSPPRRTLHLVLAVDTSGSMTGDRIASLNYAVRAAIPAMREAAADNPEVDVLARVLRFSDGVEWTIATPTPVATLEWRDLEAGGETSMGAAFDALADAFSSANMAGSQMPPVVVLLSDGLPTDRVEAGLARFLKSDFGAKAVRIAIAIGSDADMGLLQEFIAQPGVRPLQATDASSLVNHIRWAASTPLRGASTIMSDKADLSAALAQGVAQENAKAPPQDDMVW